MKSTDYKIKQLNHTIKTGNLDITAEVACLRVITNYSYPRRCQAGTPRRLRNSMFWLYFVLCQNILLALYCNAFRIMRNITLAATVK